MWCCFVSFKNIHKLSCAINLSSPQPPIPTLFWRPIHVALCGSISFLLTTAWCFVICSYYFLGGGYPDCHHQLPPLCFHHQQDDGHCVLLCEIFSRVCVPTVPVPGHRLRVFFTLVSPTNLLSKRTGPVFPFISLLVSPHPCHHLVLSDFLFFASLLYVKWYLIFLLFFSYHL